MAWLFVGKRIIVLYCLCHSCIVVLERTNQLSISNADHSEDTCHASSLTLSTALPTLPPS